MEFRSRRIALLIGGIVSLLAACGGDDKGGGNKVPDAAAENFCPDQAPDRDELDPSCCFRKSNADRTDSPEFRLTSLNISAPTSLDNVLIEPIIQGSLDGETVNWLIQVSGADADGDVTITTGYGIRGADGTFTFAYGEAPEEDGSADRWNPIEVAGNLAGETLSGQNPSANLVIPIGSASNPIVELPLAGVNIVKAEMSESRSCVGSRGEDSYVSSAGELRTFITVEASADIRIDQDPINAYLCNFIAQITDSTEKCTEVDRADWALLPDSICDETGCTVGSCEGTSTCNAWELVASFSAAGVEINESEIADGGPDAN